MFTNKVLWFIPAAILIVIAIAVVLFQVWRTQPKETTNITSVIQLSDLLLPTKTVDNLPQNTLEIPREKWSEKMPALAERVLKFLEEQGVAPQTLPQDKIETYQAFLGAWGKPWRVHYLKTAFSKSELQLIWDELLLVQANTPEELETQKKTVAERLTMVNPPVELAGIGNLGNHFATEGDTERAIQDGRLVTIKTVNLKTSANLYTKTPFAEIINKTIDEALSSYKDVLEISSATRSLELQILLKEKLGYFATKVSYHTMGQAIDVRLSKEAKKRFDVELKKPLKAGSEKTRLMRVNELNKTKVNSTITNLVKQSVLTEESEVVKVYRALQKSVAGKKVDIIDETPFSIRFDKDGAVQELNPVFHLQYSGSA